MKMDNNDNTAQINDKRITKTKVFVSWEKEIIWLNECGAQGMRLVKTDAFDFKFVIDTSKKFVYFMEWIDCHIKSDTGTAIVEKRAAEGLTVCANKKCWVYYVSESETPIEADDVSYKRTVNHYKGIFAFCAVTSIFLLTILIYDILMLFHFNNIDYTIKDMDVDIAFIKGILNKYLLNQNPAAMLLWLLIPITALFVYLTTIFGNVYIKSKDKKINNQMKTISEENIDG